MNEIKFSVLMSIYKNDKKEFLIEALESILKQSLLPNEIVIIKDGTVPEELEKVIITYKSNYKALFKIVQLDKNYGLGLAMRFGLNYCSYEWVARMDADDISHPERFKKQIEFIKDNLDIAIVGTNSEDFDKNIEIRKSKRIMPERNIDILKFAKRRCPFIHPTIIFNKTKIIEVGSYEDIRFFEDYNLFFKVLKKYEGYNIQEILFYVRNNSETSIRRGGLKYLKIECQALFIFYKKGFINLYYFITNLILRSLFRICGNNLRKKMYIKFLRKKI